MNRERDRPAYRGLGMLSHYKVLYLPGLAMLRFLLSFSLVPVFSLPALAAPPNVLLIVGDDQAWTDYGFMGHEHIRTPHLDQLASEGLVFRRGYVPTSLCRASLATMITGLYPHQHLITSNDPPIPRGLTNAQAQ